MSLASEETSLVELAAELPDDAIVTDPVLVQNYRYDWARDPGRR